MKFELYKIPQGKILIAFSDKNLSVGVLELNPNQELSKHNRPVLESLFQVIGNCKMKLFDEDGNIEEIILKEGNTIDISKNIYHIHSNPYDEKSITFWKANGDITEIIKKIRESNKI